MKVEQLAGICHDANRAYCKSIGDQSQVPWTDAPDWQRGSAINGVKMHLARPWATPEDSHKSWLAQKEAEGWKYGPVKDAEAKTHPCVLPYDQLMVEQRAKDYLFTAICHALAPFVEDAPEVEAQPQTQPTQIIGADVAVPEGDRSATKPGKPLTKAQKAAAQAT